MIDGKKVIVVLPAYNAESTLRKTYQEIPLDVVDDVVLTDDQSMDRTVTLARELRINHVLIHTENFGYGRNQKTCYKKALELGADIVVMLHADYQYNPALIPAMCHLIATGTCDVVLGSRILGGAAVKGGMPLYKYFANRFLTIVQNLATRAKLSEYHTGYRAYTKNVLTTIPIETLSDNHIFDNEILSEIILKQFRICEISSPANYFEEASTLGFGKSVLYGIGVLRVTAKHLFQRLKYFA